MARILLVDDDPDIRAILADRLAMAGHEVIQAEDGVRALELHAERLPDLLLLDLDLPGADGFTVLDRLRQDGATFTAVVITAYASIEKAVEAMRRGAFDFIPKPFSPGHVELVVNKALDHARLREENRVLRAEVRTPSRSMIGSSSSLTQLTETARRAADSKSTILLLGESGTGKEVLARAIHAWSPRARSPFVAVNCSALSEELLESELFGHERGSFTGAHQQKVGKFELANRGTIFLDEIGDLKEPVQVKLLRVLQEHEFERVGGTRTVRADLRVIAATNRDLTEAVSGGRFREDLYYRLNVVTLHLPPLRERRDDIPALAEHFLAMYCAETGKPLLRLSAGAIDALARHSWPGNVRELENAIERAVVLARGEEIEPVDLALAGSRATPVSPSALAGDFHARVEGFKRDVIRQSLANAGGNQTRAAAELGLQRSYLARLIKNLGLR